MQPGHADHQSRPGVRQQEGDLSRLQQRVDWQHQQASLERAEVSGEEFGHVGQLNRHDLAGGQASSGQPGREAP